MSTTGVLRPNNVVFYHPLDDFVEHTQAQAWTVDAIGGFTAGKIRRSSVFRWARATSS